MFTNADCVALAVWPASRHNRYVTGWNEGTFNQPGWTVRAKALDPVELPRDRSPTMLSGRRYGGAFLLGMNECLAMMLAPGRESSPCRSSGRIGDAVLGEFLHVSRRDILRHSLTGTVVRKLSRLEISVRSLFQISKTEISSSQIVEIGTPSAVWETRTSTVEIVPIWPPNASPPKSGKTEIPPIVGSSVGSTFNVAVVIGTSRLSAFVRSRDRSSLRRRITRIVLPCSVFAYLRICVFAYLRVCVFACLRVARSWSAGITGVQSKRRLSALDERDDGIAARLPGRSSAPRRTDRAAVLLGNAQAVETDRKARRR